MNGMELNADVDEQERLMLNLADGQVTREQLTNWLEKHVKPVVP
jgi:death-on-curing protein